MGTYAIHTLKDELGYQKQIRCIIETVKAMHFIQYLLITSWSSDDNI